MESHQTTREARAGSEHLEDAGNCRQNINQEPNLCCSLLSEQKKLRHVLDWAHRFLSSGSELHRELCRADSLILATEKDEEKRETEVFDGGGATSYENREKCKFLCGFKSPLQDEPDVPFSRRDDVTWPENRETENIKSMKRQHSINKQSPSQSYCTTNRLNISNQRHQTHVSDSSKNQTLTSATCSIEGSTSCRSNVICKKRTVSSKCDSEDVSYKINGAQEGDMSDNQKEVKKQVEEMVEGEEEKRGAGLEEMDGNKNQGTYLAFLEFANDKMSHSEIPCHLKTPSDLTVYEQYQHCVDRLHRLRLRPSIEAGCFADSPARGKKTCEETAAPARPPSRSKLNSSTTNPEVAKYFSEATTKTDDLYKNKERTKSGRCRRATLTKHEETKHRDNLTLRKNRCLGRTSSVYCNKHGDFMKRPAGAKTSIDKPVNAHVEDSTGEERAAPPANSVLQPKRTELHPGLKCHQSDVKGQKKTTGGRGPQRFNEKSSMSLSSLTNGGKLPRPQSVAAIQRTKRPNAQTHTKRHTPEDGMKHASPYRDTPTGLEPTRHNDDTRPTSPASDTAAHGSNTDYKHTVRNISLFYYKPTNNVITFT
ncbi:uncharacterized protein LOC124852385 [Hippoglossus stenolepis]|uniref:uncharacterized protein LOC124852385 n=1 Tax=Hippoglossus stenolepis TaxID=195615 RepID=UPI001FAF40AE|nr:uncharacterized protein LOC124852385 [Hippoglossus stenolepis]